MITNLDVQLSSLREKIKKDPDRRANRMTRYDAAVRRHFFGG